MFDAECNVLSASETVTPDTVLLLVTESLLTEPPPRFDMSVISSKITPCMSVELTDVPELLNLI